MSEEIRLQDKRERKAANEACCTPVTIAVDTAEIAAQVKLLAALADPTRLQMVQILAGLDEPLCVCDIMANFELGQPTISHHLKVLREARLVTWEKRGLWVYYALNRATLAQVAGHLDGLQAPALALRSA